MHTTYNSECLNIYYLRILHSRITNIQKRTYKKIKIKIVSQFIREPKIGKRLDTYEGENGGNGVKMQELYDLRFS